jgi:hypothetical protein
LCDIHYCMNCTLSIIDAYGSAVCNICSRSLYDYGENGSKDTIQVDRMIQVDRISFHGETLTTEEIIRNITSLRRVDGDGDDVMVT